MAARQADMPGVSKEQLNLRVEGNSLLVEGTIGIVPQEQMTALNAGVRSTLYRRSFVLRQVNGTCGDRRA
jgi:HSP20 family molecular chaperone IbpA